MKIIMRTASVLMGIIVFLIVDTAWADLTVVNYTLVGTKRVGRVEFEYTYQAQVTNNGPDAANVIAQATSSSPYTTIVEGQLEFGDVAAGATKDSTDAFTIKQNRTYPMDWSAVSWDIQSQSGVPEDVDLGIHTDESQGGGGLIGGPVRIINGNSLEIRKDLNLASPHAGGLALTAVYNSRSHVQGVMGYGWSHTYGAVLHPAVEVFGQTLLKVTDATGRGIYFSQQASDQFQGAFHEHSHVNREGDEFVWYRIDGRRYGFSDSGTLAWIEDQNANRINLGYNSQNRLDTVDDTCSGRTLKFHYYANGKLEWIEGPITQAVPAGRWVDYQYDDSGEKLVSVKYADGSIIAYEYSDPADSYNLSFKRDGGQHLLGSWSYDSQDRCTEVFRRSGIVARMDYSQADRVIVNDAYDVARTFTIASIGGRSRVTDLQGPGACSFCLSDAVHWDYDANMNLIQVVAAAGAVTQYNDFDQRGNPAAIIKGSGSAYERTISQTYHPRMGTPLTQREASLLGDGLRETIWDYDNDGNTTPNENPTNRVSAIIQKGYTMDINEQVIPYESRITLTYNAKGQVETINGPLPGDSDLSIYSYDSTTGDLMAATQPVIGSTTFDYYYATGQPRQITDVNGVVRQMEFDGRGKRLRIANLSDGSSIETAYDSNGQKESTKDADDVTHTFQYESQFGRLSRLLDADGNYIEYAYEDLGRPTQSAVYDASAQQVLLKRWSYQHPTYPGRLYQEINPDNSATTFEYYPNGNLQSKTDPKNNSTVYTYDIFNRLHQQTLPDNVVTQFDYDRHGNLVSVIDAEQHATTYQYDDAGRLIITSSPDTGKEVRAYDQAGRLQSVRDARGITTTTTYDALNRITAVAYPEFEGRPSYSVNYTYDEGLYGMGRLTGITDQSGQTQFDYSEMDTQGRLRKVATINGTVFSTIRVTSPAGRLESLTYPSGRTVAYTRDSLGQLASIVTGKDGTTTTLVDNLIYSPFGPATGMNLPNIGTVQNQLDLLQRPDQSNPNAGSGHGLCDYQYDPNSNLESIAAPNDSRRNQTLGYSAFNRLTNAIGSYGSLEFAYDAVGNRATKTEDGQTDVYTYVTGTNRLDAINGPTANSFSYDARGNTTTKGALSLTYDQDNRLVTARNNGTVVGEYVYNGMGQRVIKNAGGITTYYHYDLQGNLIAETPPNADFTSGSEFIYNGLTVMAKADIETSEIYIYHVNHLGTPELMTDSSGAVVWQAIVKPFGDATVHQGSTVENPIRFPGQYYDQETGFHYNNNRYYDPDTGRYLTADPIGLAGGINPYGYVQGNPVNAFDPFGLLVWGGFLGWSHGEGGAADASVAVLVEGLHDVDVAVDIQVTGGPQLAEGPSAGFVVAPFADYSDVRALSDRISIRFGIASIHFAIPENPLKSSISVDLVPGVDVGVGFGKGYTLFPGDVISATNELIDSFASFIKVMSPLFDLLKYLSSHEIRPEFVRDLRPSLLGPVIPSEYNPLPEDFEYLVWGTKGDGPGQFENPVGIAVSNDGYIYVTDMGGLDTGWKNRIQKFDSSGNFILEISDEDPVNFANLKGITVDNNGNIYVLDDSDMVREFDSDGNFVKEWCRYAGESYNGNDICSTYDLYYGYGIAASKDGYLYVSDSMSSGTYQLPVIRVFDLDGNRITDWGVSGSGDGQFVDARGIAVDSDGYVYIADRRHNYQDPGNNRIQMFSDLGSFITEWGGVWGSAEGEFKDPDMVAADKEGNIYVSDYSNHRIQKFNSSGAYLGQLGSNGTEPGQFIYPRGIAVDGDGYLYIVDSYNYRIQKIHSSMVK